MSSIEGIFSLRIVIAEFYMEKPVPGLDACYSEFRGKEIKRVPVIRIFGANGQGQKTCMHVHGVFPYFYIPYDRKDFPSLNQAIYQIAINLDKAINISLSQSSSSAQHVFKVQLVKGIPFYGYHRSDHQFLRIYMFNPRFVRRAANLLQNGAILNKNFHPHESHVPYILQFMIDYNLYGMSFLHVPLEIIKFRRSEPTHVIPFKNLEERQILDCNLVKKISCSSLEIDIGSNFILNRFQLIVKTNTTHTNPGIESIWNDERLRRQKLAQLIEDDEEKLNAIPALEIPPTQERPNVQPTESEIFHRTCLLSKLLAMETSISESTQISNQTLNSSDISSITLNPSNISLNKQQKRTFNLTKILQNSVYPEECIQNDNLINASFIQNHLSNNSVFEQSPLANSNDKNYSEEQNAIEDESIFMEDTIVDEDLVLSLTQSHYHKTENQKEHVPLNATLRDEDMKLLDILQQLEEDNEDQIDLDSSLAPLSQKHKNFALSPEELDKETTAAALQQPIAESVSESESESDENVHDFSIALENLDDIILKLTQSQREPPSPNQKSGIDVPQVDGADDLLKTPTKSAKISAKKSPPRTPKTPKNRRLTMGSPRRSPRTPKTGHKFAPLPLVSINRSSSKTAIVNTSTETTPIKRNAVDRSSLPFSLRNNLPLSDLRRKSISVDGDVQTHATTSTERTSCCRRRSKRFVDLDKTHVTCALTQRKTSEKLLKVYTVENQTKDIYENNEDDLTSGKIKENCTIKVPPNRNQEKHEKEKFLRSSEKKEYACETIKIQNFKTELQNEFKVSSEETAPNNTEINQTTLCSSETDEEVIESDNEAALSLKNSQRTPTLKRLRRNFTATNSAKRRKTSSNINATLNHPFKFHYRIEDEELNNRKNDFILKKCKVKLKRISKAVKNESSTIKNEDQGELVKCNSQIPENLENQEAVMIDLKIPNSSEATQSNNISENKVAKEKEHEMLKNAKQQQNIAQNLNNLQKAFELHLQTTEVFEKSYPNIDPLIKTSTLDDVLVKKSPDKEITQTPQQESDKSLTNTHLYIKTGSLQSPLIFSQSSSPALLPNKEMQTNSLQSPSYITLVSFFSNQSAISPEGKLVLTPLDLPPTREEVIKGCCKLQLPQYEFQQPFYSNPDDITKHKELGFTILQISGNKLNDLEEFQSILGADIKGLTVWRREQLLRIGGMEMLNKYRNTQRIREYFSNHKTITITPQYNAPTRQEVKLWLKARELLKNQGKDLEELKTNNLDEDSPIKVRRQKVTMILNAGDGDNDSDADGDNSLDCSSRSLTLTPLTTTTPTPKQHKRKENANQTFTPVTRNLEKFYLKSNTSGKKRNNCRVLRRVSLNRQFKEYSKNETQCSSKESLEGAAAIKDSEEDEISDAQHTEIIKISQDIITPNTQNSETSVSSEMALAELEKSSFMRNLRGSDSTIGGSTENSTLNNTFGFKVALENLQQAKADVEEATSHNLNQHRNQGPLMRSVQEKFITIDNSLQVTALEKPYP